jgi:hypothetical protein
MDTVQRNTVGILFLVGANVVLDSIILFSDMGSDQL